MIDDANPAHAVEASTAYEVNMLDETEQVARTRAEAIKKLEHLIAATKKPQPSPEIKEAKTICLHCGGDKVYMDEMSSLLICPDCKKIKAVP